MIMPLDGFIHRADGSEDLYQGGYDASELLHELEEATGWAFDSNA
jgi:hypothetical protein